MQQNGDITVITSNYAGPTFNSEPVEGGRLRSGGDRANGRRGERGGGWGGGHDCGGSSLADTDVCCLGRNIRVLVESRPPHRGHRRGHARLAGLKIKAAHTPPEIDESVCDIGAKLPSPPVNPEKLFWNRRRQRRSKLFPCFPESLVSLATFPGNTGQD